jgi:hypothetical protein
MNMSDAKPMASLSSVLLARKGAARPAMRRPTINGNGGAAALAQDDLGWNDMGYDVDPDPTAPMDYDHAKGYNPLAGAVPDVKPEVKIQQDRIAEQLNVQAESVAALHQEDEGEEEELAPVLSIAPVKRQALVPPPEFYQQSSFEPEYSQPELPQAEFSEPEFSEPEFSEQEFSSPLVSQPVVTRSKAPKAKAPRSAPGLKEKSAFTLRLNADRHLRLRLACAVSNKSAQQLVTAALDAFIDSMPEIGVLASQLPAKKTRNAEQQG